VQFPHVGSGRVLFHQQLMLQQLRLSFSGNNPCLLAHHPLLLQDALSTISYPNLLLPEKEYLGIGHVELIVASPSYEVETHFLNQSSY
jgi:hypothetical protein